MNSTTISPLPTDEVMVEATHAAAALSLPYDWFSHNTMRERLRIAPYLIGNLVRYRMSELAIWAAHCNTVQKCNTEYSTDEGTS